MSSDNYTRLQASDEPWCCKKCLKEALPFFNTSNSDSIFNASTSSLTNTSEDANSCPTNHNVPPHSTPAPKHSLNFLSLNCRSLCPKIDDLRLLAEAKSPHVILLCETWLDDSISNDEICINNYNLIRRDRSRHGGGIAMYVRDNIPFSTILSHPSIEFLLISLKLKHCSLLCALFYRPPSSDSTALSLLESSLEAIPPAKLKNLVLLGDFNIDVTTTHLPPLLQSLVDKLSLQQVVSSPTRVTNRSSTTIDHAYISDSLTFNSCVTLPPIEGSDHNCILVSLGVSPPPLPKTSRRKVWLYKRADFDSANRSLSCIPSFFFPGKDVNAFWQQWADLFLTTMSTFIPSKSILPRRNLPYFSKELVLLVRRKQRHFAQAKRLNTPRSWSKYNKVRNKVTTALRSAKRDYLTKLSSKVQSPKDFWPLVHKLNPNRQRIPSVLSHQSISADTPSEKVNLLNKFFSSCFSQESQTSLHSPQNLSSSDTSLSSISCSEDEVHHLLSTYKLKTASGPDGISSTMLRNTAPAISPSLTSLFNLSLKSGVVPSAWKSSNVTPILKSGNPTLVSNYRPISLLSLVSKVLERIVHNRVSKYLSTNSLLSNQQFGFRAGSSTQEALLTIINDWHQLLSSNRQIGVVFLDVKKAFDSVPHSQILDSLAKFGISGPLLSWFSNYLSGRLQRVVLDGSSSSPTSVTSGVPQGSILGPLLFIIFMDSISKVPLLSNAKLYLYADDIVLFMPLNNTRDVHTLQDNINLVHQWAKDHGLTLNSAKSNVLPITRSTHPIPLHLCVDRNPIPVVSSVKYLGVTITSKLSWSEHVNNISKATRRQLSLIYRKFANATPQARSHIFRTAVLPKLDYCSSVWDPHLSTLVSSLESVQKYACRVVTKHWRYDYETLLSNLGWQTLRTRRKLQKLKVCYTILSHQSCIPATTFTPHPHPSPRLHHNRALLTPFVRTVAHKSSFFIDIIPLWNSLSSVIVNSSSPSSFKSRLKQHFASRCLPF